MTPTPRRRFLLSLALALALAGAGARAQPPPPELPQWLSDEALLPPGALPEPTALAFFANSGRALLAQLAGTVALVAGAPLQAAPYLSLDHVDYHGERGLLGIALAPDDAALYVYSCRTPQAFAGAPFAAAAAKACGVSRLQHAENGGGLASRALAASEEWLWVDADGVRGPYHYGGGLALDAAGAFLYVGLGDKTEPQEAAVRLARALLAWE